MAENERLKWDRAAWDNWALDPAEVQQVRDYLELQRREAAKEGKGKRKGVISGSRAEAWADEVLRGGATHAGPDVLAAYAIKGAAVLERGTDLSAACADDPVGIDIAQIVEDINNKSE